MIRPGLLLVGLLAVAVWVPAVRGQSPEPRGVVSLRITVQEFNPAAPWSKTPEQTVLGNAVVVADRLLLTTADLVKNATLIEARKFGQYPEYTARAVLVDHETDLALLRVADRGFWEGLVALPISPTPVAAGHFSINRWRSNGRFEQGSGEVIELRVATSRYGSLEFPELRGTTAMTGLGWGEVLTSQGRVVGIITSHNKDFLQATTGPLLRNFIQAAQRKPYRGFAHRGFAWQQLNHPALRGAYGLGADDGGVLVRQVYAGGTGSDVLKKGDILLQIGPHAITPEGKIPHPLYGPILFTIALNETLTPTISAKILRDGKRSTVQLERRLYSPQDYRIHPYLFDRPPDFEIFGGLVVQELSLDFLRLWGVGWQEKAPARLVMEYFLHQVREAGHPMEKVLVITAVLPDPVNLGYEAVRNAMLLRANGKGVASLEGFRQALQQPQGGFHVLELMPGQGRAMLIFRADKIGAANQRVRTRYGVPEPTKVSRGPG